MTSGAFFRATPTVSLHFRKITLHLPNLQGGDGFEIDCDRHHSRFVSSSGGALVFASRPRVQRYTKTGVFACVRTLFVTLPSTTAASPPRPCDAMAMRSQPLSEAAETMP